MSDDDQLHYGESALSFRRGLSPWSTRVFTLSNRNKIMKNGSIVLRTRRIVAISRLSQERFLLALVLLLSALCNNHNAPVFVSGFFLKSSSIATNMRPAVSSRPAPPSQQHQQPLINKKKHKAKIRIRSSQDSDIKTIAEMLSTAIVKSKNSVGDSNGSSSASSQFTINWKAKMDQLWAKADIEAFLRVRLEAIHEGKRAVARISDLYGSTSTTSSSSNDAVAKSRKEDQLVMMWKTSERLRKCIQKASSDTGEDNLWRSHNFANAPTDPSWFHHLQMTAQDVESGQVVGFCEVAMLSNPLHTAVENDDNGNNNSNSEYDDDDDDEICDVSSFAPAITNLATASPYRRRGIASRMLRRAERFVQRKWGYNRLGLYVEKENTAAVALYQSLGYQPVTTCDGGGQLGELWYMVRELKPLEKEQESTKGNIKRLQTPKTEMSTMQAILWNDFCRLQCECMYRIHSQLI